MRRIVVTGLGVVSPLGCGLETNWTRLISGQSGIRKIDTFQSDDLASRIAGIVPSGPASAGQFTPEEWVSPKELKRMDRFIPLALAAAQQAVEDSGWMPTDQESLERTGVMIGAGIGGLQGIHDAAVTLHEHGARRVSPFFIPSCLINLATGYVSIKYGFKGPNHSVVTACSTGTHAIGDAARLIQYGDADVMVAGGTEGAVCRLGVAGFAALRALSSGFNDTPELASRPWDQDRDGFVIGEGSGILVLEEYEHAKKRDAKIYAEVIGYGLSSDAYHITSPAEDGDGAYRAMRMALKRADITPEDIDYINAHATSTPVGDRVELNAVNCLYENAQKTPLMSSTKSAIGHLLGAAGSVEAVYCIMALQNGIVPPTLNLHKPIEGAKLDLVPLKAKEAKLNKVMSNSFGFGGTNSSIIFQAI